MSWNGPGPPPSSWANSSLARASSPFASVRLKRTIRGALFVLATETATTEAGVFSESLPAAEKPAVEKPVEAEAGGGGSNALGWILLGGGVVSAGAGVLFTLEAFNRQGIAQEADDSDECRAPGSLNEDCGDFSVVAQLEIAYWVAYGVGAVGIGSGLYLLLSDDDTATAVVPTFGPGHVGLRGRF